MSGAGPKKLADISEVVFGFLLLRVVVADISVLMSEVNAPSLLALVFGQMKIKAASLVS